MLSLITLTIIGMQRLPSPAIQMDPLLLVEANEIWSIIGKPNNPVWPGWDARKTPILIYFPGRQDLLLNHPKPPAGFVKYAGPIRSPIGPIYLKDGATIMQDDGQNTSIPVGGVETLVIADTLSTRRQWAESLAPQITASPTKADETVSDNLHPNPYDSMVMFAHEAFHVYQRHMAGEKGGSERTLEMYPSLSVENNVGFTLESDCLAKALAAKSSEEVRQEALKWLAVRLWRRSIIGTEAGAYEDGTEFSEGTAKYVEYRVMQALKEKTPSKEMWLIQGFNGYQTLEKERQRLIRQMIGFMSGTMGVNNDLYGASPVRFRLYYSGMGVAALLDRLGANWHDKIFTKEATLTAIAQEAIHATSTELTAALASVRSSTDYPSLVEKKAKLARDGEAYVKDRVSDFDHAPGVLVLDYSKLIDPKVAFGFTPFGILKVDSGRSLFRLVPIRGTIGETSFVEESAQPMMQDHKAKTLSFLLPSAVDVPSVIGKFNAAGSLVSELKIPGISLKNIKGRATTNGNRLVIELQQ